MAIAIPLLFLLAHVATASAAADAGEAQEVFKRFADAVVQIRVVERGAGAKAVIGSGFFVDRAGHIVTNYHVVSKAVQRPERYEVERVDPTGEAEPVTIQAIDVVHDVAILRAGPTTTVLVTDPVKLEKGARIYAMGHPHDLGLSIVEGTYNGPLEHSLYRRIHFTGSLNPGMSGGPALTAAGRVVGVNVSTSGNQVSFLVPVERVNELLGRVRTPNHVVPKDFMDVIRTQILAHQETYSAALLATDPMPAVSLGPYSLPGKLAPFLKCWGDAEREESKRHVQVSHECSTDDYLFLSDGQWSGIVSYRHHVLTTDQLNRFQFHALYSEHFGTHYGQFGGTEDEVTRFRCRRGFVRRGDVRFKTALCLRGYRRLPGVYDAVLKVVTLGSAATGAESSLALAGVSFETVERIVSRFVGAIAWKR